METCYVAIRISSSLELASLPHFLETTHEGRVSQDFIEVTSREIAIVTSARFERRFDALHYLFGLRRGNLGGGNELLNVFAMIGHGLKLPCFFFRNRRRHYHIFVFSQKSNRLFVAVTVAARISGLVEQMCLCFGRYAACMFVICHQISEMIGPKDDVSNRLQMLGAPPYKLVVRSAE